MTDSDIFDLVVIGGGINGVGIARDAAGRGARVTLVERGDLAQGTSSASTKLIHGGLRYLEHLEFALVRESLVERERLWAIAPHIIRPLRFVLPHRAGARPRWLVRLGLFLYDHIGGRDHLPGTRSINLRRDGAGAALQPRYRRAFEYSDCWVDDARLVVLTARDAADRGACILTHHDVMALHRDGALWRLSLARPDGSTRHMTARSVVNAAGPGVEAVLALAHIKSPLHSRLVRGSHIVVPRKTTHDRAYFCQNADERIFFAIPFEDDFTLIGTTDADHHGDLTHVRPSEEEVDYLCKAASDYFSEPVRREDIIWSYAGVRPLVDDGSGKPEAATRGYRIDRNGEAGEAPMLTIFGGKITTHRHLAHEAVAMLHPLIGNAGKGDWTRNAPLPGGNFSLDAIAETRAALGVRYAFVPTPVMARLFHSYGTDMVHWIGDAQNWQDLGQDFGHGLTEAEVDYLMTREWATTSDDILWRRSKLGLRFNAVQRAGLDAHIAKFTRSGAPN